MLVFDDTIKGFGVRVMPDRPDGRPRKVFLVQYRAAGKVRREKLGDWFSELTAAQARKKADVIRGKVRDHRDPVGERKAAEAAARASEQQAKRAAEADAFTLRKLVQAWETRALSLRREGYRKEATARVRQGLAALLDRPAASLARTDAAAALEELATSRGAITANRVMAYARACYGWAAKANLVESNPFAALAAPGRENARDRVLTVDEVQRIWEAAEALQPFQRGFVRFLLLTLQRRTEVAGATWSEISTDMETWTIPKERAKNGRAHVVHLAPTARTVLQQMPRGKGASLVFALPGGKQLSSFSVIKRDLDAQLASTEAAAAAQEDREAVPVPPWVLHDFRRAGVTALAGLGFAPHVCDRLLNHVSGTIWELRQFTSGRSSWRSERRRWRLGRAPSI